MTGRNGSPRKGLFAGFLTGSALCLCVGAAASYVSPITGATVSLNEPTAATNGVAPSAPKDVTAEVAIITPKSDSARTPEEVPDNEAPAADRDDANIAASIREGTDPIQTDTSQIEAPDAEDGVDTQTAVVADITPVVPETTPLSTVETAPEQASAQVDVSSGDAGINLPNADAATDEVALETPKEDAPISLAMNAPKVEAAEEENAINDLPDVADAPEPAPKVEDQPDSKTATTQTAAVPTAPSVPTAPKAEPVIALSKPVDTPIVQTLKTAPVPVPAQSEPEKDETTQSAEPVMAAPEDGDVAPNLPKTEAQTETATVAPVQVETPTIDAEPEAPLIRQASVAPEVVDPQPEPDVEPETEAEVEPEAEPAAPEETDQDAPKPAENAVNDRRNPAPPSFEGPAFEAFAVKFIPPNNKPFLTIILEHVGEGSVNMYDLLNFAQPITFGVNSFDELAKWRENEFRKGGFEVVALVPGIDGAGLSEDIADQAIPGRIEDYLTAVPGAVAILDGMDSNLYRNPRKVSRVADELKKSGRGLIVHEKFGVNRALEAARSADIPASSLIRVIDAQRDAAAIRRALDRAALDASKTGATIVFGRTYPETVAALLPWLLGNSARSVTLAPLTSTMKRIVE